MMKWLNKIMKEEDGQDVIEFAFVLPLFLILVMGIIDFGWLFYNYISIANSARNAARIACVEYMNVAYDGTAHYFIADKKFTYQDLDIPDGNEGCLTQQEKDIVNTVKRTLPGSVEDVQIQVDYTYDTSDSAVRNGYAVDKRSQGDVTVTVEGDMHVLTPVLGITADHMKRSIQSDATFKVEKQYNPGT